MGKHRISRLLFLPIAFFLVGYVLLPMVRTVVQSFTVVEGYSLANYTQFLSKPFGQQILGNTIFVGVSTVLLCGLVGTTLALLVRLVDFRGKRWFHALLLSPMMVPGVLIVISYLQLYGESGVIQKLLAAWGWHIPVLGGMGGILFIHSFTQYIYFYTNVSVALQYLDASQLEAAKSLGASPFTILRTVILPECYPAFWSSAMVTFVTAISAFSAPNLIGGGVKVLSTQIMYSKINRYYGIASMQVCLLLLLGLSVLFTLRRCQKRSEYRHNLRGTAFHGIRFSSRSLAVGHRLLLLGFVGFLLLPIVATLYLSLVDSAAIMQEILPRTFTLENYRRIFTSRRSYQPFFHSITMALTAILAGLCITLPIAYHSSKEKGAVLRLLEGLVMLPLSIPVGSIAINLINAFGSGNLFSFGRGLIGTYQILPIAYTLLAMPILFRTNTIAIEKFHPDWEHSAKSLGAASPFFYRTILLPLLSPSILGGALLVFIRLLGEYNLSAFLYGIHNKPISIAMIGAVTEYDIGLAMAYGSLTILLCGIAILLSEALGQKALQYR